MKFADSDVCEGLKRRCNTVCVISDRHWDGIGHLRDCYLENKETPTVYEVCRVLGETLAELRELFPQGYRRGACRGAGLPFLA